MAIKDPNTIMQELASIYARTGIPDMTPGTFEWDLFVYGPTYGAIYPMWEYLSRFESFLKGDYSAFPPDVIKQILESAGIVPSQGTVARGYVKFFTSTAPASPISIPEGTVVAVDFDTSLQYRTTEAFYVEPDFVDSYFDSTANLYMFSVPVEAVAPGFRYNVPPDTINLIVTPVPGIEGVMNTTSITGGSDPYVPEDSFSSFVQLFMSRHPLSEDVLQQQLLSRFPEAGNVVILRPGDPDNLSNLYSNTVEVYVAYGSPAFVTDSLYVTSEEKFELVASPFIALESVSCDAGIVPSCVDSPDEFCYELFMTTDPIAVGTVNARASIRFRNLNSPVYVNVMYQYDSLIYSMQTFLDEIDMFPNVFFVVRRAPAADVNISCRVKLYPGADIDEVKTRIYQKIFEYIASTSMGAVVSFSDLFGFIVNDDEVDDAYIGTFTVRVDGPAQIIDETIQANKNAVLRLNRLELFE